MVKDINFKIKVDDDATAEDIADQVAEIDGVVSVYEMHKNPGFIGMYETDERPLA